jgi:hypothetical protein
MAPANSTNRMGTPSAIHEKNGTSTPVRRRKPMPIRFGAVPTGVPSPPIDAPSDADSSSTAPYRGDASPCDSSTASSDRPIGSIIATVAVLLIHIEIAQPTAAYMTSTRMGRAPTPGSDSIANAKRRSRP